MAKKLKAKDWDAELSALTELIQSEIKHAEEWAEDENSAEAEYCASFGYGDGELELDRLDDDVAEIVAELQRKLKPKAFRQVIQRCSNLHLEHSYYRVDNSVFSLDIGEREEQLDCEIWERVKKLPGEFREKLEREVGSLSSNGFYYINLSGTYWHMVLDLEKLERVHSGVKRSRPSWNRVRRMPKPTFKPANTPMHRRAQFKLVLGGAA